MTVFVEKSVRELESQIVALKHFADTVNRGCSVDYALGALDAVKWVLLGGKSPAALLQSVTNRGQADE